ncbi:hypothetical protein MRX96_048567 [Rhipicephalus microplus]
MTSSARAYRSGLRRQPTFRWRCTGPCSSGQYPEGRSGHNLRWAPPPGCGERRRGWKWRETILDRTRECRLVVLWTLRLCWHFLFLACRLRQIPGVAGGFRRAGFMTARLVQVTI